MTLLRLVAERPDENIKAEIDKIAGEAAKEWRLSFAKEYPVTGTQFGISQLRADHVGLTNNFVIAVAVANTWQDWLNTTIDEKAYVVIAGIFNRTASPGIYEIGHKANGQDLPVMPIEELYTFDMARGYFTRPYSVRPDGNLTTRCVGTTVQTENLGLLGYTIAKRAYLIKE